jgi:hypothetical protein
MEHPETQLVNVASIFFPNRPSAVRFLVVVAVEHYFVELKIKRNRLPAP